MLTPGGFLTGDFDTCPIPAIGRFEGKVVAFINFDVYANVKVL